MLPRTELFTGDSASVVQKMGVRLQYKKKGLVSRGAVKKRFRITGRGHLKCWPNSVPGKKKRIIAFRGVWGPQRLLKQVIHTRRWHRVDTMAEKSKYRENIDILDTLDMMATEAPPKI